MFEWNECFAIRRKRQEKVSFLSFLICFAAAVFLASTPHAYAKTVIPLFIDQQYNPETGVSFGCGGGNSSQFQSFTPTGIDVFKVVLRLRAGGSFPPLPDGYTATIHLRSGSPEGTLLGTATSPLAGLTTGQQADVSFYFSPPVSVVAGQSYVIEWKTPDPTVLTWMAVQGAGAYPGGMYYSCAPFKTADPTSDCIFTTWTTGFPLQSGLVAHYPFDGDASDVSGNGNNGTVMGGGTFTTDRFGNPNGAFSSTTTSYVNIPDSASLDLQSAFTLSAWFKMDAVIHAYSALISKDYATAYSIGIDSGGNGICPAPSGTVRKMRLYVGPYPSVVYFNSDFSCNTWYHVAVTFDDSANQAQLYVDGNLVDTQAMTLSPLINTSPLGIGKDGVHTDRFVGAIDDVRIYNRVLTSSEIAQLYTLANTSTTVQDVVATYSTTDQTLTLNATVTSTGGIVNEGTVTFTVKKDSTVIGSAVTSGTVTDGIASASYTLPGGTPADTYAIEAAYTGGPNFPPSNGSGTLTVAKAVATVTLGNLTQTYTGDALTPTATTDPAGLNIVWTGALQTNAGPYPVTATVNDANYQGSASGTFTINKATATINVTKYSAIYNGDPHTATGTATGVCTPPESLIGLDLSGTTHSKAGSYTDPWTFTDVTGNYNNASGTVNDFIDKANATISVNTYSVTYDGNPQTATGTAIGVKGESLSGLDLSGTTHTNAGQPCCSYTDPWTFTDFTGNYKDASGTVTDVIEKANATIIVMRYDVIYDRNPHTATGTATGVKSEDLSSLLNLNATTHINAGDYPNDSWSFAGNSNYNSASATVHDFIDKATPIITWDNPADITYPTALGDAQLNAMANYLGLPVPGLFVYTPWSCSGLAAGNNQTLSVAFTPFDTANYYGVPLTTVKVNVLVPKVTKEQIGDSWICTQSDASGYPVAMYLCTSSDCSSCMTYPMTTPNRCVNSSLSDIEFGVGNLKWVGSGSETVDFVTSDTIYRCIEGIDLCFSCPGGSPWSCDPSIPNLLSVPAVNTKGQEKIDDVWLCAESPDLLSGGCFTKVYSCSNASDQNPCPCGNDPSHRVTWSPATLSNVAFSVGQLKWVGPGSDNLTCETVYFVTTSCIYKCISDTGNCFVYPPSCAQ